MVATTDPVDVAIMNIIIGTAASIVVGITVTTGVVTFQDFWCTITRGSYRLEKTWVVV